MSLPSKSSSAEEIADTIMEEEEHPEEVKSLEKMDSSSSLIGDEILDTNSLQGDNSILREVTVTGGE